MNIKRQQDYVEILKKMHGKILRVCGVDSPQETSMRSILLDEEFKLEKMQREDS
jgi:hypothetical protein